jgi:hypothetical protein
MLTLIQHKSSCLSNLRVHQDHEFITFQVYITSEHLLHIDDWKQ